MVRLIFDTLLITDKESKDLAGKQQLFDFGQYKSELHFHQDVAKFLGVSINDSALYEILVRVLKEEAGYRIMVYPNIPQENCIISKGVLEILKRRK